jgi:hypothetical protein
MYYFLFPLLLLSSYLSAGCCDARVDIGPAFASIDMLESGKTVRTYNLGAIKGDAAVVYQGFAIKPSFLYADGKANLTSGSIGVGFCIPVLEDVYVTPSYGFTETRFKSSIEKFSSHGQYVAMDVSWSFMKGWRVYGMAQWCWSRVHTTLYDTPYGTIKLPKSHCKGPNYAIALEHDISDQFSVSIAGGYNTSLSKEKHGLRGKGVKLGLVYWW